MKYLVLLTLLSFGCLVYLVSSVDLSGFSLSDSRDSELEQLGSDPSLQAASLESRDQPLQLDSDAPSSSKLVLLKFGAPWCPPCRMVDKELRKLERTSLPVEIRKINVDDRPQMARQYGVSSIPRLILLQDGRKIGDRVGYQSSDELVEWISEKASDEALAGKKRSTGPTVVHANPFFK